MNADESWLESQRQMVDNFFSASNNPYHRNPEVPYIPEHNAPNVISSPHHEFGPGKNLYPVSEKQISKDRKSSSSQSGCCIIMKA